MIIGLTGGIGSGKSTVSSILRENGCIIFDADAIYKELTQPGMPLLTQLTEAFGDILNSDGTINRTKLSEKALGNPKLNEITHKAVTSELLLRAKQVKDKDKDVYLDVPLLFECGLNEKCDRVWLVRAPEEIRIERVKLRDGLAESEIKKRISLQMSDEEKAKKSNIIIDNDCSYEELEIKVKELLNGKIN